METVQSAIIIAAGAGTRAGPLSSSIDKAMANLDVVSEHDPTKVEGFPVAHFVVQSLVESGVNDIVFVTSRRGRRQLMDYFGPTLGTEWKQSLEDSNKQNVIDADVARREAYGAEFRCVIQPRRTYGTAGAVFAARKAIGRNAVHIRTADDIVYGASPVVWSGNLTVSGTPIPREDAPNYGIFRTYKDAGRLRLREILDRPSVAQLPEHEPVIANISQYIAGPEMWDYLKKIMKAGGEGEYKLTDIVAAAHEAGQPVDALISDGKYLDCGTPAARKAAVQYIDTQRLAA